MRQVAYDTRDARFAAPAVKVRPIETAEQPISPAALPSVPPCSGLDRFEVLSTAVHCLSPNSFVAAVRGWLAGTPDRPGQYVVFRDVHGIIRAEDDARLRAAHADAYLVCPDGLPLTWLARLKGHGEVARVCGPDMLPLLCAEGVAHGWRHVFFGSTPAILDALAARLREAHPGLVIADLISPPFHKPDAAEGEGLLARIRSAQPHIVWIGLGSPKQELWMHRHAAAIPGALCMGVGAAFDLSAGAVRRAPPLVQRLGLEWCYRILQEPNRLTRRYAATVPRFVLALALDFARTRRKASGTRGNAGRV